MKVESKFMTEYKKHIRVDVTHCKRNFNFQLYGSREMSLLAAIEFEKYAKSVMYDFDFYGRKPDKRKVVLDAHGLGSYYNKKAIPVQRKALTDALSTGESTLMEKEIVENVWKKVVPKEILEKTSIGFSKHSVMFTVDFHGSKQQLKQPLKTLQLAVDWAKGMHCADQD